ncbi:MAG: hypothetical protein H0W61_05725 [Bacteroidetes bacterium]|nr:hypothetical protein [Bacteroidota bacterium]
MRVKYILTGQALLFISFITAQTIIPNNDNEFDKKYTPDHNSIFNGLNKKNRETSSSGNSIEFQNILKFSPTLLFRQKAGLFYERSITNGFSITFGLAKAFGRDYIETVGLEAFTFGDDYSKGIAPGLMLNNSTFYGSLPLITTSLRLYYSGTSFEGGYIELGYRRETMEYLLNPMINSNQVEGNRIVTFTMNAFSTAFGFSGVTGIKGNITHDFFVSCGLRSYTYTEFEEYQISTGYTNQNIYRATGAEAKVRLAPSINVCYLIGFGF